MAFGAWNGAIVMMIGGEREMVQNLDPIFATLAPGTGNISPLHPGAIKRRRHGGTRLPALWPKRRWALC